MSNNTPPSIVVSGLRGGGGKTILSLSITAVLKKKGMRVVPFKKGPDYIDAGWLAKAAGNPCYNLDLFMMTPEQAYESFQSHARGAHITVIEGNRGLYDGVDHQGTYSTAEMAKLLDAPVIIVVDCTKVTNTVSAMVLGCQKMDEQVRIGGIVLNRVATGRQEALIRRAIGERCGLPVLGAIPRLKKDPFPERHMGLTPFQEHEGIEESIKAVTEIGEQYLDIDAIVKVSGYSTEHEGRVVNEKQRITNNEQGVTNDEQDLTNAPRIGVIRDSAFQFYYEENFEELEKRGAQIVEVSPLREDTLPDIDALYIGGGFPETHAIALAENTSFRQSLYDAIQKGLPVYAECGGLMYLGRSISLGDTTYEMVGALPVTFGMEKRPRAHGYTVVEVEHENPFYAREKVFKGHEFHYSRVIDIEMDENIHMAFNVKRGRGIVDNKDGICYKNVLASYTHLHAIGTPEWADGLVKCAVNYKKTGTEAVDTTKLRHKGTK